MSEKHALVKAFEKFSEKHEFKPGDLVTWKPGMKNRTVPKLGEPAVVVEVLAEPILSEHPNDRAHFPGSPYYREPRDIKLGVIDDRNDDFTVFHFDSRRFELYVD